MDGEQKIIQPNQPTGAAPPPTAPAPVQQPPSSTQSLPPGNKRRVKWLAIALALLLVVGGAAFALLNNKKPAPSTQTIKKEVPLLIYGTADGNVNSFYPDMELLTINSEVNEQAFEGLVQYENQTRIKPLLAASWTNPDDSTWIFNLKQNVKFHTGRLMTAHDVKHSLEEFKKTETGSVFATTIKKVDVVDDHTVKVTTDGPDPILLNRLVFMYIVDSKSKLKDDPQNGTGPFTLKPGTKPTATKTEFVAYDDYHGGRPLTRAITFMAYKDEAALTAARKDGKVSVASDVFDKSNVELLKANSATFPVRSIGVYNIGINVNKAGSPVQKLKVRQAIYAATDIPALLKARNVAGEPASQIVTQDIPGYDPSIIRPAHDIEHAKHLLMEAGYPKGITLTLTYFKPAQDAADELKRQLGLAGIKIVFDGFNNPDALTQKTDTGKSEINFSSYATDTLDAMQVFTDNFQNANYSNATVNKLIKQANQALDPAVRLGVLQNISKKLMADVAWVPLYSYTTYWMNDPSLVITKDLPGTTLGAYFWKTYAK